LAIGDVAPGQAAVPHRREEPASYPAGRDRQKTRPLEGPRQSPDSRLQSGYARLSSRIRRHFLILIDARFSSHLSRGIVSQIGCGRLAGPKSLARKRTNSPDKRNAAGALF
jgi:hypothetical protein